ncbi:MAG TPA: response regulator [Actinomycetota bacterium]|jgi:DNA-binding response OmpR family regulator
MSGKRRVLIIEDDPQLLLLMRVNIEEAGFETSLAADGTTGLRRIEAESPDAVVLDLALPGIDGWSVLAELDRRERSPAVIVCSAKATSEDRGRAYGWGASAFIEKPFSVDELVKTIGEAIEQALPRAGANLAAAPPLLADPEPA